MNWNDLERHFSAVRMGRYRAACGLDEGKAAVAYCYNLMLAGATMPVLNVLEIALKNGVHRRLALLYGRVDWWAAWAGDATFLWHPREVSDAVSKIVRRHENVTSDKIIAELPFGI